MRRAIIFAEYEKTTILHRLPFIQKIFYRKKCINCNGKHFLLYDDACFIW